MTKEQFWMECVNYHEREEEKGRLNQDHLESLFPLRESRCDREIKR